MRRMILIVLLLITGQATADQQLIDVQHDSVRGVTCWIIAGTGISCLPDSSLQRSTPTGTTTDESQAPRASLANIESENGRFPTTSHPAQRGFQL
ncbi:hypothetical protein [Pseudomonas carnis]|uniref:Secreted protein n=1 Tax=Pseudomonas carnis TaxID=2487355 RepID=A0ABT5RJ45_9PSED|nr:hypothetical protein [Pseudomonas carnis]MDD1946013.1 hypothetical protein [Pseudomonas carnis]